VPCRRGGRLDDRGSAVVEFAVVVPLLVLVVLAVVQVGLALHVRATIQSAAAEGARVAAISGPATGVARTRSVLATSIADGVVEDVTASTMTVRGVATVVVVVHARLPLVGLLGPTSLVVQGHALVEV
jgi:hypothetical protein